MAINLFGANDAYIGCGDIATIAGLTEISVALTIKLTAAPSAGRRIVGQWQTGTASQSAFLFTVNNSSSTVLSWFVHGAAGYRSIDSPGLLANGQTYRIVGRWRASDGTMLLTVNGENISCSWYDTANVASLTNASVPLRMGRDVDGNRDGADADYAELAIWGRFLSNEEAYFYGLGYDPTSALFNSNNRILYVPAVDIATLADGWGSATVTNNAGTDAGWHPSFDEASLRITQVVRERINQPNAPLRMTQFVRDRITKPVVSARVSQFIRDRITPHIQSSGGDALWLGDGGGTVWIE